MANIDLQEVHDLLVSVAHDAGHMMLSARPSHHGTKKNSTDLVTETDQAVERHVLERLKTAYPTFHFIGEETFVPGQQLTDAYTFILDPIDGTTNFVHNFPAFCISLGVTLQKISVVGVIYNPLLDELYSAITGKGAYRQKAGGIRQRLPLREVEPLHNLSSCLVGVEWGSDRTGANFQLKSRLFTKLAASKEDGGAMVHSLRCTGSTALNLAAVASGQLDVFWEGGSMAWDVCAGWCILVESGGILVDGNPGNYNFALVDRRYLAVRSAPSEHEQKQIVEEFWKIMGDERLDFSS